MAKPEAPSRTSYHHGNLREALVDTAIRLVEEGGPENVSLREVAKRLGVSPAAPFRHFPNKTALLTAVAEQAMALFRAEVINAVESVPDNEPMARFAAVGSAYLHWAIHNPTHFQIISTRNLIDWDSSESLRNDNMVVRSLMEKAILDAQEQGKLRSGNVAEINIAGRAMVYGLARMHLDGHFAQWALAGADVEGTVQSVLSLFVSLLGEDQSAPA
jgi:AcrR family transcriptional regulator